MPDQSVVQFNGDEYVLDGELLIENLQVEELKITGNRQRADRINASQIIWDDTKYGFGFFHTRGALPDELPNQEDVDQSFKGAYRLQLETRWSRQYTLPGLAQSYTDSEDDNYSQICKFGGSALAFGQSTASGIALYNGGTDNWDQTLNMASGYANSIVRGCVETSDGLLFFGGTTTAEMDKYPLFDGSAWTDITTSGATNPPFSMVMYRNVLYAVTYNNTDRQLTFEKSIDNGTNWTAITTMDVSYPTISTGFVQLVEYSDASGQPAIYLHIPSGLYLLDLANERISGRTDFQDSPETGIYYNPTAVVGTDGFLYIARVNKLIQFHNSGSWIDVSPLTNSRFSTTDIDANTFIMDLDTNGPFIFVGFGGSLVQSVYAFDGEGFHYIWSETVTAGSGRGLQSAKVLFNSAKASHILHIIRKDASSESVSFRAVEDVMTNPLMLVGKEYATSGFMTLPTTDAGQSDIKGALLGYSISADLTTLDTVANDNETITITSSLDHASFGNSITWGSDSDNLQKLGSSNGVAFNSSWGTHVAFARGSTNTKTPVLFSVEPIYLKGNANLKRYTMLIDLEQTVLYDDLEFADVEKVLDRLEEASETFVLKDFSFTGTQIYSSSTRHVIVKQMPTSIITGGVEYSYFPRVQSGRTRLVLEDAL